MTSNLERTALPLYCKSIDWTSYLEEVPPADIWYETMFKWSRDELRAYQERHFAKMMAIGWNNAFYRKLWGAAGIEPGDLRGIDDLPKLPTFDSEDVKASLAEKPPFGEVCGIEALANAAKTPLKVQTSGGTTGLPRPTLFGPLDWEYNGAFTARAIYAQTGRPGDMMQITSTLSLANMGWAFYKACHDYLGIVPITTGTGVVTPSRRQLEYALHFGVNAWVSFPEYLTQLAHVMKTELGRDLRDLKTKFICAYLGPDTDNGLRRQLEDLWGCDVYDNYGTHEIGSTCFEGLDKDGLYIMEDAAIFEFIDVETRQPVPTGSVGDICVTHLHRGIPPLIRYNLRDLGRIKHEATSALGSNFKRMDKFLGRSDQMVKIRGVNIYPMACLQAVRSDERSTGEWICVADRFSRSGVLRDEMTVRIELREGAKGLDELREHYERRLHNDLGVKVAVELVPEGGLPETNVGKEGKPRRLIDNRGTTIVAD
ncbi:phenylacetate--CoA ligase family protein [Ramlibacter sp.]|uniref:phenylacetate--CoA ligase family protein n=1 Tax=Ramlibacter sp. TaxID=1917967 RepID=UPI003D124F56